MRRNVVDRLIEKFGSQKRLGAAAGVSQASVSEWRKKGWVPARRQPLIIAAAPAGGIEVTPDDFFDLPIRIRKAS